MDEWIIQTPIELCAVIASKSVSDPRWEKIFATNFHDHFAKDENS